MKILLTIHHELDPDAGASGVTWMLGKYYQSLGHEVYYYSFNNLPSHFSEKVKTFIFPWFLAVHISMLQKEQGIDVIDASTGDAWVWAKIFHRTRSKSPILVVRSHGLEHSVHHMNLENVKLGKLKLSWKYFLYHAGFRLWEVNTSLRCADLVLMLNKIDLKYSVKNLGVDSTRARVVRNGIPDEFINILFEPISYSENARIGIVQIGSYIDLKGLKYSTPALNKLLNRYPQVHVSLLGTRCPLEEVYADFDVAVRDRVQVVPHYSRENLPDLLRGHQINLLASLSEGFGMSLIEAMACGLAPVATETPGPLEILTHEYDALLVPARSSLAIEQALEQLITDYSYLEQLRRNAYNTAQHYNWARIAKEQLSLYEGVLS